MNPYPTAPLTPLTPLTSLPTTTRRKSDAQQALLSNASHAERAIYSRVSQGLYTCKSVRGGSYDIPALLHGLDARKCGKITAKAFVGVLTRSANVALSREDARHLAAVLDTDGSGAVDVEYFLALFSDDQDYLPNEDTPSFVSAPPGAAGAEYPARTPHRSAYKSPAVEESALPRTPTNMRALVASPAGGQQQQAGGGGGGGQYLDDPALARDAHIRKMLKEAGRPDDPECIKLWRTCRKIMARLDGCHSDGPTVAERVQRADRKGCGVLKASELHRVLRDAGVQLTAPEFDCVAALFRPHGRGARPGEVDSAEFCKVFDLAVWAKDPAQRPDGDRGGRAEAAAEAFAIENEQRHLLRNAPSADWALFKKIKTRFAEIGLTGAWLCAAARRAFCSHTTHTPTQPTCSTCTWTSTTTEESPAPSSMLACAGAACPLAGATSSACSASSTPTTTASSTSPSSPGSARSTIPLASSYMRYATRAEWDLPRERRGDKCGDRLPVVDRSWQIAVLKF